MAIRKNLKLLLFFLLCIRISFAQIPLPLYEKNEKDEFLLTRIDSSSQSIKKQFDTVSILSYHGICYGRLVKFRQITQKECCTKPDPKFLLGKLNVKDKNCTGPLILGKVEGGQLLNYDSLKMQTNLFEWISEEYQNPLISKEYITRYRWTATEVDGKKEVFLESKSKNNNKDIFTTYRVALKNCIHIKTDSVDYFYCSTDTSGNYKKQNRSWHDDPVKWSILYVNKKLIYVIPDFSSTTIDGYGPFHYKEQKLTAIYRAKGITYFHFLPGFVIWYKDKSWNLSNRKAVKYYGECDCGE